MKKLLLLLTLFLFPPFCVFAQGTIDINIASLAQIETLTGIGAVKAQAIIDARPFSSVDDLIKVSGIGEKTLQKIKDQGLACVSCQGEQIQKEDSLIPNTELKIVYPSGIFINEILPSAEGADEENEWIELFNSNTFDVDLAGWKIQDSAGTQTTYIVPTGKIISADGYLVFSRPETNITLNNDEDAITLLTPADKKVDSASYPKANLNQSYNRMGSDWQWSTNLTPGTKNIIALNQAKTDSKDLPKEENSVKNNNAEAGLASISQNIVENQEKIKNNNPWFLFFIVLALTIILATAVLFIKFKLNKTNVRT